MIADGSWSLGVLIGLPAVIITVGLFLAGWWWLRRWSIKESEESTYGDDGFELRWAARVCLGVAAVVVIIAGWAFYPYSVEYHKWLPVEGTVQAIDKRIVNLDSQGEKFVVRFSDEGGEYGCTDTRCAIVRPGDFLELTCKRVWQYAGVDGYDCNYVESRRA